MLFYIIETTSQLKILSEKQYNQVFVEPIYFNNNVHPALNQLSLLYIKPLNNDKGYIICINHSESLSLHKAHINALLNSFDEIYVLDRKQFIYHFPIRKSIDISFDLSFEYDKITTKVHEFFYRKHNDTLNINCIIPIVKHYERCELLYDKIKNYCVKPHNEKYTNKLTSVFFYIEKNGIKINKNIFETHFETHNNEFSIKDNKIYTQYNLNTTTGRPSNSFNNINFAALEKDNGCREAFIPENDYFVEFDVSGMHPNLAAQIVGFDFGYETPYEYFARKARIELSESKLLMFKQLYGGIYEKYKLIPYFLLIQEYIDKLWDKFQTKGEIECVISGTKFTKDLLDMNPQKLFNFSLQNLETSTNVFILWNIIKLLKDKQSKIVLYTYDAILFDYCEKDNLIEEIQNIFTKHKLKTKVTKGLNYNKMLSI